MTRPDVLRTFLTALVAALAGLIQASPAIAQDLDDTGPDSWRFSAGLGVVSQPKYPGSDPRRTSVLPLLSANYGRYFIGGTPGAGVPFGVGALLVRDTHWRLGVGLGYDFEKPRKESDSSRFTGLGDVDRTALGSLFGGYEDRWWAVRGNVRTDIGGKHEGTLATLELEGRWAVDEQLMLSAGPSVTWADSNYMRTFYGVSASQSASSGLAAYSTSSGIETVRLNLGAAYRLTPSWSLGARLSFGTLHGEAASSPITEKQQQNTFGLFANYRF